GVWRDVRAGRVLGGRGAAAALARAAPAAAGSLFFAGLIAPVLGAGRAGLACAGRGVLAGLGCRGGVRCAFAVGGAATRPGSAATAAAARAVGLAVAGRGLLVGGAVLLGRPGGRRPRGRAALPRRPR